MMAVMADERRGRQGREGRRRKSLELEGAPADAQEVPGWSGRIMVWLRVVAQLIAIQLLLIAGTLLGLVVAGLGPAAVAGGALLSRLVHGDASETVWRDFWSVYRAQFRRAALVTAPLIGLIALAWYEALVLLSHGTDAVAAVLAGAVIAAGLYGVTTLAYAGPVLRRYTDGPARTLRFLALAPLLSPLYALGAAVTAVSITLVGIRYPIALALAGLSIPLLLTGLIVDRWLDGVDRRSAEA